MRVALGAAVLLLAACASDHLSVSPPSGVDFSGKWKLNAAESDDPLHLLQAQNAADKSQDAGDQSQSQQRRRGGRPGGPGGQATGPMAPPIGAMNGPLRWPGKELEVKQVAGVVAFSSEQENRVCQPESERKDLKKQDPRDRTAVAGHEIQTFCGWLDATLVVRGGGDEPRTGSYEEHYDLSDNRQRLVETIVFKGGRSNGYTLSRVWDRVSQ